MRKKQVVVVGAGMGGMVAALELANHGMEVTVVERAAHPGGKLRQQCIDGKCIDAGPTVFTMREVFEQIFTAAGASLSGHLTLKPASTLARHAWNADERLDLYSDLEHSADAIAAFAGPREARSYLEFCERARRVYATLESPFILGSRPSPWSLVERVAARNLRDLTCITPFSSLWRALGRQFRDPRLQQLFGRYSTYMGSSPFLSPATLMLIAHVERTGVWLVDGGMYRLAEALCSLARRKGVTFRFRTEAQQVSLRSGRLAGLELSGGEYIEAGAVIINADPASVSAGLFGAAVKDAIPKSPASKRSLSALTWAFIGKVDGFPLHRHTVFFSADYASEFNDIFRRARLPTTPTVYVCAQDRDDRNTGSTDEPERLFCLVNAPPTGDRQVFDQDATEQCRQRAFALMQRCGLSITPHSEECAVTAPNDFEQLFPATGGALYGPASHGWRASFQRPGSRTRIPGLYLAGGSTHPGAGLPMAALSGRQAAFALLQDLEGKR